MILQTLPFRHNVSRSEPKLLAMIFLPRHANEAQGRRRGSFATRLSGGEVDWERSNRTSSGRGSSRFFTMGTCDFAVAIWYECQNIDLRNFGRRGGNRKNFEVPRQDALGLQNSKGERAL